MGYSPKRSMALGLSRGGGEAERATLLLRQTKYDINAVVTMAVMQLVRPFCVIQGPYGAGSRLGRTLTCVKKPVLFLVRAN